MEEDPNMGEGRNDDEFNDLLELLLEKEPLVQSLDASKEYIEGRIGKMETEITKGIKAEWDGLEQRMTLNQHKRNREIIKEIITTCKTFRTEIKEKF